MNNIEIIEEFIEQYNASYPDEKECVAIYPEQIEAIENLIQYNKKLKERCKELIKEKQELTTIIEDDFIPKSKVKEKIKELEKLQENNKEDVNRYHRMYYRKNLERNRKYQREYKRINKTNRI